MKKFLTLALMTVAAIILDVTSIPIKKLDDRRCPLPLNSSRLTNGVLGSILSIST